MVLSLLSIEILSYKEYPLNVNKNMLIIHFTLRKKMCLFVVNSSMNSKWYHYNIRTVKYLQVNFDYQEEITIIFSVPAGVDPDPDPVVPEPVVPDPAVVPPFVVPPTTRTSCS